MRTSFNAFRQTSQSFGGHTPIWLGMVGPVPIGGVVDPAYVAEGMLIGAGAPINLTGGVIKPLVLFEVVSVSGNVATVRPNIAGILPEIGDTLGVVPSNFTGTATDNAVSAVAVNAANKDLLDITLATAVQAGKVLAFTKSNKLEVVPNAYLYNDIFLGALEPNEKSENVAATGAAVQFHAEGILVDRTPAAAVAAQMAVAVPSVLQVNR